ncbi:MAG TPA: cupredoxin domain-containing protein [Patescibacteria group bacterium]|nr:cupredoxin domain-containing protein [Patescibacteria group bacterium]
MNKKFLIALAAGLALFGAGCATSSQFGTTEQAQTPTSTSSTTTPATPAPTSTNPSASGTSAIPSTPAYPLQTSVTMDEKGFHPSTVQVSVGGSVSFLNTGKRNIWPIFGLAALDAKRAVRPGETLTVNVGPEAKTYSFYDKLNTKNKGTLEVK